MRNDNDRLYLIDWLKILILAAIRTFHTNEFVFFEDDFPLMEKSILYLPAYYFARIFSLGGQGLVSIIYLLFGFSGKSTASLLKISGFAIVGQIVLTFAFFDGNFLEEIEWDIYLYIAVTNIFLIFIPRASWPLVILSLIMLIIPPSIWKDLVSESMAGNLLIGRSENSPHGAWPLLPWFFLALLFFNLGSLIRTGKLQLRKWYSSETFLWPILLGLSIPFLGHYYWTPIGPKFYEFNFHQSSHLFWPNFLPYVFILRIAFLDSIKEKLSQHKLSRFVSSLMWARQLGAAYIISILYLGLGSGFEDVYRENVYAYDLFFISIMPMTEIIVRVLMYLKQKLFPIPGGSSAR